MRRGVRAGAAYFTEPALASQRRYEALRAYIIEEMPAAQVADRFGYSTASVMQMATLLRRGQPVPFAPTKPGPQGARHATRTPPPPPRPPRRPRRPAGPNASAPAAAGPPPV